MIVCVALPFSALVPIGLVVAALGARWLLTVLDSRVFQVPADGTSSCEVPTPGAFEVYHRAPRMDGWPSSPTVVLVDASGEERPMRAGQALTTWKQGWMASRFVGSVTLPIAGPHTVQVLEGGHPTGMLQFCRPTTHLVPFAFATTAGGLLIAVCGLVGALAMLGFVQIAA